MKDTDQVDKVAEAMRKAQCGSTGFMNKHHREEFRRMAQAAIDALGLAEETTTHWHEQTSPGAFRFNPNDPHTRLVSPWVRVES